MVADVFYLYDGNNIQKNVVRTNRKRRPPCVVLFYYYIKQKNVVRTNRKRQPPCVVHFLIILNKKTWFVQIENVAMYTFMQKNLSYK